MTDITMPQLGETVTEGTITKWFKQVGETVKLDEPLFEVSTDKVDTEVGAPAAGVLLEIRAAEGDVIPVGGVIAVVGAAGDAPATAPAAAAPAPEVAPTPAPEAPPAPAPVAPPQPEPAVVAVAPPPAPAAPAPAPIPVPSPAPAAATPVDVEPDNRLLSPVVRRLVSEHGIDPSSVVGTGPGGRITREDVLDHVDKTSGSARAVEPISLSVTVPPTSVPPAPPAPPAPAAPPKPSSAPAVSVPTPVAGARDEVVTLSKIRRLTGDHMRHSIATAAAAFSVVEVDYANVDAVRDKAKAEWKTSEGFSLTYLPFISRAIVDAIAEFPHMNASMGDGELIVHRYVDLGIAVDLDYQGLIVPVIRNADGKRLRAIARETFDLANRARGKKLAPDEISGGTFTVSNNGSAGSVLTMAVINQPQVAIISTDAIRRRPVVVNLPGGGESIAIHSVGNLAMTWDHRAFDGAYAAGFLSKIKEILETRDWASEL